MKKIKAFVSVLLCVVLVAGIITGCSLVSIGSKDIVVLFTSNVRCQPYSGVGYSAVKALHHSIAKNHSYMALVDCGGAFTSASNGENDTVFAGKLLSQLGYSFANLGQSDFECGDEALLSGINEFSGKTLCSNLSAEENEKIAAYSCVRFGSTTVGFVGVCNPSVQSVAFSNSENVYEATQKAIDGAKGEGAAYVIVLSSLAQDGEVTTKSLIENTSKADVYIDGSASEAASSEIVMNDNAGRAVKLTACGEALQAVGQIVITADGTITISMVTPENKLEDVDIEIANLMKEYPIEAEIQDEDRLITTLRYSLSIADNDGVAKVKSRETTAGNFVADAYCVATQCNVAFVDGIDFATEIPSGDIYLSTVKTILPSKDKLVTATYTGAQIADILEMSVKSVQKEYAQGGMAVGEDDAFLQVSGLKFTVNTSVDSSVTLSTDDDYSFGSIGEARRVSDIQICNAGGQYEPLNPELTYIVCGTSSLISGNLGGNTIFAEGKDVTPTQIYSYNAVADWFATAKMSDYYSANGRITIA